MSINIKYLPLIIGWFTIHSSYGQHYTKLNSIYFVQYVFKGTNDSLYYGKVFINSNNKMDDIVLENLSIGKPCIGACRFRDTFIKIINRNKCYLPLMGYEIANLNKNDSNEFSKIFKNKLLKKKSNDFYTKYCHEQLSFWCNKFDDLDSSHDIILNIRKINMNGNIFKIKNSKKYITDYSLYNISYNYKFGSNSVFFSKGVDSIKMANLYLPNEFIKNDEVIVIWVRKVKLKKVKASTLIRIKC